MKTTILRSVLCVAIAFASVLNFDVMAQDKFVTNDVMAGELVASKIIYRHDGMLYRHMKHDFKYDNQSRVIEKETFKWDSGKDAWVPYTKVDLTYALDQVVMNYAKWNKKDKAYNEAPERNIYELNATNVPVAYQNYKWNNHSGEWKIVEDFRFVQTDILYAIN